MKSRTPIKRHQALVSLSRDHHFGLLLTWKIKQGLANAVVPERISNYVLYFFDEDLQQHFKEEEQILFPKIPADNLLRQKAEKEHADIYDMIGRLRNDKSNEKLLLEIAKTLKSHIRFEERELFNYFQNNIEADDLTLIEDHSPNNSKLLDEKWDDVFWEIKK